MSLILKVLLTCLTPNIHGLTCPDTQTMDTHQICRIFQNTNIQTVGDINFNDDDYCNSNSMYISCDPNTLRINVVEIEHIGLDGELDFTGKWPSELTMIDLEQTYSDTSALTGDWNWNLLKNMNQLYEIDIENNEFTNTLSNTDWNIIASLPSLTDLTLVGNYLTTDFSQITLNTVSTLQYLELSWNNFYGTMDVSTNGFISKFPELIFFWMEHNSVNGHFNNLDVFSSAFVPYLQEINIEDNHFSGQLVMTNSLKFADSLSWFEIDYNDFSGDIDWNMFNHLYSLKTLDMNDNAFTGTVDWTVISNLVNNGVLNKMHLRNNRFAGYVDFSWMTAAWFDFSLDVDIHCDPVIYPCIGGVTSDRTDIYCYSKSECEATCQCTATPPTKNPTTFPTKFPTVSPVINGSPTRSPSEQTQSPSQTPSEISTLSTLSPTDIATRSTLSEEHILSSTRTSTTTYTVIAFRNNATQTLIDSTILNTDQPMEEALMNKGTSMIMIIVGVIILCAVCCVMRYCRLYHKKKINKEQSSVKHMHSMKIQIDVNSTASNSPLNTRAPASGGVKSTETPSFTPEPVVMEMKQNMPQSQMDTNVVGRISSAPLARTAETYATENPMGSTDMYNEYGDQSSILMNRMSTLNVNGNNQWNNTKDAVKYFD